MSIQDQIRAKGDRRAVDVGGWKDNFIKQRELDAEKLSAPLPRDEVGWTRGKDPHRMQSQRAPHTPTTMESKLDADCFLL